MRERLPYQAIWRELSAEKAMVFLAGPRQAGKTTFARSIARGFPNHVYFNWDLVTHKRLLLEKPTFFQELDRTDASVPLVVLDEIHKYRRWKNYLKGVYDQFHADYKFLVLGSGRLNLFQRGGDSLAGRYFPFTLWPFTLGELSRGKISFEEFLGNPLHLGSDASSGETWAQLSALTGFPEPFSSGKEAFYRRWSKAYHSQLVREDIRNATEIRRIDETEILFDLLPSKVGSPLSMDSLARDLQVSFNSIRDWLDVFESFFLTFRLSPWTRKISRAITKEKKLYLFDYAAIDSPAARFENMVALELLRAVSNWTEHGRGDFGLHYLRNKEKEEVDFLITKNRAPFLLVEAKLSEEQAAPSLLRFQSRLEVPAVQLVNKPKVFKLLANQRQRLLVGSAADWLAGLP